MTLLFFQVEFHSEAMGERLLTDQRLITRVATTDQRSITRVATMDQCPITRVGTMDQCSITRVATMDLRPITRVATMDLGSITPEATHPSDGFLPTNRKYSKRKLTKASCANCNDASTKNSPHFQSSAPHESPDDRLNCFCLADNKLLTKLHPTNQRLESFSSGSIIERNSELILILFRNKENKFEDYFLGVKSFIRQSSFIQLFKYLNLMRDSGFKIYRYLLRNTLLILHKITNAQLCITNLYFSCRLSTYELISIMSLQKLSLANAREAESPVISPSSTHVAPGHMWIATCTQGQMCNSATCTRREMCNSATCTRKEMYNSATCTRREMCNSAAFTGKQRRDFATSTRTRMSNSATCILRPEHTSGSCTLRPERSHVTRLLPRASFLLHLVIAVTLVMSSTVSATPELCE